MRALVLLLFALPALAGEFPVCDKRAQYARIELVDAFPPTQCVVEAWEANPAHGFLAALGLVTLTAVMGSCNRYAEGGERSRIVFKLGVPSEGADEVLGHELRHAFAPREFHPPMLPMVTLPCE